MIFKATSSFFPRHYSGIQSSGPWWHESFYDYLRVMGLFMCKLGPDMWIRQNRYIYMNIFPYMSTTWQFQQGYLRSSWMNLGKYITSSLRVQDQFLFTLDVISSVTVMVFEAFLYTNMLKIWSRPIWICLVQIQNYTSLSNPL